MADAVLAEMVTSGCASTGDMAHKSLPRKKRVDAAPDLFGQGAIPARDVHPATRKTDPETSHEAAASIKDLRKSQEAVLRVFGLVGQPMTDEELVTKYWRYAHDKVVPDQTASGIRTRRAELVRLGYLRYTGRKAQITTGNKARVWERV